MWGKHLRAILLVVWTVGTGSWMTDALADERLSTTHVDEHQGSSRAALSSNDLSNNNYETNVDGQTIHAPAYSGDGSVPSGRPLWDKGLR